MTSKTKKAKAPSKVEAKAEPEAGYAGHKLGSRKGKVHEAFDQQGAEVAWTLGHKLKLKPGTLRSWFAFWKRQQGKSKDQAPAKVSKANASKPEAAIAA
jgi:hypothetical protein